MSATDLHSLKRSLYRAWVFSPERLWLLSIRLADSGHWKVAFWVKQLNSLVYKNSLSPGASVAPDVALGHNSMGIVVAADVTIGHHVKLWHNVTLSAGRSQRPARDADGAGGEQPRSHIVLEDWVRIGANAVVIAPSGKTLRIGHGARIGAGTVVTVDVPPGGTLVGPPARLLGADDEAGSAETYVEHSEVEHPGR